MIAPPSVGPFAAPNVVGDTWDVAPYRGKTLSAFAGLVRDEFDFLERRGFRYGGEVDRLPAYTEVIYESQGIRVRVYWDGRDHMSWTVLGRRRRFARSCHHGSLALDTSEKAARVASYLTSLLILNR